MTCYDLIKEKRFEEAISQADTDYRNTGKKLHLNNKILALLLLRRYEESATLAESLAVESQSDDPFIFGGIAYYLFGRYDLAEKTWKAGVGATYTDAAGGITIPCLLYFLAVSLQNTGLQNESTKLIERVLNGRASQNFPGIIGSLLLDSKEATRSAQMEIDSSKTETMKQRKLCKISFYQSVVQWSKNRSQDLASLFEESARTEAYLEPEYYLATGVRAQRSLWPN